MPNQPKSPILAGRVDPDLKAWVVAHAKRTGCTVTDVLVAAVTRYREQMEGGAK